MQTTVDQPSSKQAGIAVEMLGTSNWVNTECLETEWGQMIHNIPDDLQIFEVCNQPGGCIDFEIYKRPGG